MLQLLLLLWSSSFHAAAAATAVDPAFQAAAAAAAVGASIKVEFREYPTAHKRTGVAVVNVLTYPFVSRRQRTENQK